MKVISVNIGKITTIEWRGREVSTSIFKKPVNGNIRVGRLNLEGDEQADLKAHGGEHRALMVYQKESYDYWKSVLGRSELPFGSFGENLTVEGLSDDEVCIGDRYSIGTAIFEVTQPRVTCYKVGISLNEPEMPALLVSHKRPGFYFRVLQEGEIAPGDIIKKIKSGPEQISVVETDALLYLDAHPEDLLRRAMTIPALSEGWKASFAALYQSIVSGDNSGNAGLAPQSTAPLAWQGFRSVVVETVAYESEGVYSFILASVDGQPLPSFIAGQYVAVRIPSDSKNKPVRMYSLCGPAETGTYRIAVKLEKDGQVSHYLHSSVKPGDLLEISAPRGTFLLLRDDNPLVLLSAGIGLTPLLAMLYAVARDQPKRPTWWIHSTQNRAFHSFSKETEKLTRQLKFCHRRIIYSRPDVDDMPGNDYHRNGRLNLKLLKEMQLPANGHYYLCGPTGYLADMTSALKMLRIPEEHIKVEIFGTNPQEVDNGVEPHLPPGEAGDGPTITLVKSNLSFNWNIRFGSLLGAVEACDVAASWSCRTGVCHRCEIGLVNGETKYDPQPLDQPMKGNVLICCAIPVTDVQLDI